MSVKIDITPQRNSKNQLIRHLIINDIIWMSNTDVEYKDIDRALETAHGDCYIGGLGLGIIAEECAKKADVKSVHVVEFNPEVIEVGYNFIKGRLSEDELNKVEVFNGDARHVFPATYDWMYFDIWIRPDMAAKRLMNECFEKGKPYLKDGGVMEGWLKDKLEGMVR